MNASVRQTISEIRMSFVKNAKVLNVNAKRHTNLLVEIVYWLDAITVANVQAALNVLRLLVALAIVHARKDIERNPMALVLMSMNAMKINISVALAPNVSIDQDPMNVYAHPDMMEIHIKVN